MQKRLVNECYIDLEIRTEGPLLIKSGLPGIEGPDMSPVVTFRNRPRPEPYMPGSSLKGVLRSHAERIARTLCNCINEWRIGACDPFKASRKHKDWEKKEGACSAKFEERKKSGEAITGAIAYHDSCPLCKICGNTFLIGRLLVPDAYLLPDSKYTIERRDGVGIDRFTGGSATQAKFDLEVINNGVFEAQLRLNNFELWQLGLLAFVLRDMSQGLVPIGSGKSRGLGQVSVIVRQVELRLPANKLPANDVPRLWGLAALESEASRTEYGYWDSDLEQEGVPLENVTSIPDPLGLRALYKIESEGIRRLWQQVAPLATCYLEEYAIPPTMRLQTEEKR